MIHELATDTAKYALGGVIARVVTFISVPVYLRFLSTHDYGLQAIALLNEQVLLILSGYAITNAVGKFYAGARRTGAGEGTVVGTALLCITAIGLVIAVTWQLAAPTIAGWTLDTSGTSLLVIRLIGVSFVGSTFATLGLVLWQLRQEILVYSITNVAKYLVAFVLAVIFIGPLHLGVVGVILGWTISSSAVAVFVVARLLRTTALRVDLQLARRLAAYGGPLVPAALLMLVLNSSDRYILRQVADLSAVGVYATAYAVASAFNLVSVTPFKQAWAPLMWKMREHPGEIDFHRRALRYYTAVMIVTLVAATVASPALMAVVSGSRAEFVNAAFVVPIIALGFALFGTYDVLSAGYFFAGRTIYYTVTASISAAVNLVMNLALIPIFGAWGAAVSFAGAYLAFASLSGIFGHRFLAQGHNWSPIALGTLFGVTEIVAFLAVYEVDPVVGSAIGALFVLLSPAGLIATSLIGWTDLLAARRAIRLLLPNHG